MAIKLKNKFAFFRRNNFVYLDNAATTQVPDLVVQSVREALEFRGNANRSAHVPSRRNAEMITKCRSQIASFINAEAKEIVITNNTTDSINLAVDSCLNIVNDGDIILVSIAEHHSNLLPYLKLKKQGARIKLLGLKNGLINLKEIEKHLTRRVKIVAVAHCSNVLGNINDVEAIGKMVKNYNSEILFIVDGAQVVAHLPVDVKSMQADFYAFSGHKMYGPDGIGVLYVNSQIHHLLSPARAGGGTVKNVAITFGDEEDLISPDYHNDLEKLMGGTANVSGLVGLSKAVGFLRSIGFEEIRQHELALTEKLLNGLKKFKEVVIFGPKELANKIGVVSFGVKGFDLKEIGDYFNGHKICVRYGSHCAFPLAEKLDTETLRVSFGVYNTEEDVDKFLDALRFFLDKKEGKIINDNLERLKNIPYERQVININSPSDLVAELKKQLSKDSQQSVVIMGGHFLGIPDYETNSFYPSIKPMLPERLWGLLEEFGMTEFPLFTWRLACKTVAELKAVGLDAKLLIVANDTTGINELKLSPINTDKKTADLYRKELLTRFSGIAGVPDCYLEILREYKLSLADLIKVNGDYYMRETLPRADFKDFISKNKQYFSQMIDYKGSAEKIDISIKILDNQEIKTCTFDTFHSKTGGKFCIVEVCRILSELFGKAEAVDFDYVPQKIAEPLADNKRHKTMIMFSPAMCNNAVNSAGELYIKLMLQGKAKYKFQFINIPFGPHPSKMMKIGGGIGGDNEVFVKGQEVYKITN